ncbi:CFEM domain-containing protein [Colletotrichum sublineola]|nr:CFEM domain-containing protein [Colletotrichum sublineola]
MVAVRISALLACFFMLGSIVSALDPTPPQVLPPCAVQCTLQELGQTICSVTDQTCMCNDRVFCGYVQSCIFANCTVKEMLVAKNYTSTLCNDPVAKKDNVIPSIQMALFMFTTLVIITRIGHKCMRISPWGWDDTTIMIAYVLLALSCSLSIPKPAVAGAGRDVWYLSASQISLGLRMFFISTFLYVLGLAFIKASILFLYLRIFPDHRFRMVLWFTQAFNLLLYISFLITALVSCQPLHYAWEGWTGETEGRCYSTNPPALSHGALNFILDVWMLLLPASQIYKLNVPLKQKLDVMSMFSMGIFLTAVSGYRIKVIRPFGAFLDSDVVLFQTSIWSAIELAVGIFVACLPNIRQFWVTVLPKILRFMHISSRSQGSARDSTGSERTSRTMSETHARRSRVATHDVSSTSDLVGGEMGRTKTNQTESEGGIQGTA